MQPTELTEAQARQIVLCKPSGRKMTRRRYWEIYWRVFQEREAYWDRVEYSDHLR